MFRALLISFSIIVFAACSANQPKADKPGGEVKAGIAATPADVAKGTPGKRVGFVEISATVKSIDMKKRQVTVIDADKKIVKLDVDPAVTRLNEVKPGDKIVVQYLASLAYEVRPATDAEKKQPVVQAVAAGKNPGNLPPAAAAARTTHAIVKITKIDREKQTVTVKGPQGQVVEADVLEPKNLDKVKVGDTIAVTFTEGLAVGIDRAS